MCVRQMGRFELELCNLFHAIQSNKSDTFFLFAIVQYGTMCNNYARKMAILFDELENEIMVWLKAFYMDVICN